VIHVYSIVEGELISKALHHLGPTDEKLSLVDNALKTFILEKGKDYGLIIIFSDGAFKTSTDLDLLVEIQSKTDSVLLWNFFASNHGGGACDADINQAQQFLKNYVQNNDISLMNKLPLIQNIINKINNNHEASIIQTDGKYSNVDRNKFKGMTYSFMYF
jgi:hypothetical protein